jgi:hypothetical protein
MNSTGRIVNLVNPSSAQDAATRSYVDSAAATATAVGSAAQTTANTAVTNAATAQTTANTANSTANAVVQAINATSATASAKYLYPARGGDAGILTSPDANTGHAWRLYVAPGGNIGIGASFTTPSCPLHVGTSASIAPSGTGYYLNLNGVIGTDALSARNISIITEGSILNRGTQIWVVSDKRIKTNIVNLNADKMMNVFRHIRPISFDFIDPMKNNNKKHFGFIAQEVNEVLPEGITLNKDVIPNNMMKGGITKPSETDETPCFTLKPDDTDITLQYLLLTTDSPLKIDTANPYSSKDTYKFKIYGGDKWAKEHDIYIRSDYNVTDDKYTYVIGMKKDVYDVVITESTLFVYGQYVNDLHILDHDTIYTVATSALQEVDREQQADKARIVELEATVAAQQSLINDILERLKKVEKA